MQLISLTGRSVVAAFLLVLAWPHAASAQGRPHIRLPASYGATPISTIINAQANYIAAAGDFLESAANARLTNAVAADKEMDNSLKWVETYFKRKEINKQYTSRPQFIDHERSINLIKRRLVETDYQTGSLGDVTDNLNWMLRELNALAPAQRFMSEGSDTLVNSKDDQKLTSSDVHCIQLTDGGHANGQRLVFRADAKEALNTRWPQALRDPKLDEIRTQFEWRRDEAVQELKDTNELGQQTAQQLMDSVDALSTAFVATYSRQRRFESSASYAEFLTGKKFLQSLALEVHRVIQTEDQRAFDGSYRFAGNSVARLIGHMHQYGLEFGPPGAGGENVYQRLFFAMREFYKQLADEAARQG